MGLLNYEDWQSFTFKGRRFLALKLGGIVHVFGSKFANYGTYYDIDAFRKHYSRDGEKLKLD
jgi:hypothetical protein